MGLQAGGQPQIAAGMPLSCVALDARSLSELFARPHADRAVLVAGRLVSAERPAYDELDALNAQPTHVPEEADGMAVGRGGAKLGPA